MATLTKAQQQKSEILVFRGRLHPDLTFELRHSYSTEYVRQPLKLDQKDFYIELRDGDGTPINRELVTLIDSTDCEPGGRSYKKVLGHIGFREEAKVLLFYKKDILICSHIVPGRPTLQLEWGDKRVARKSRKTLGLRLSNPEPGAFVQVVYQWGERRFRTLGFFRPAKEISLDFSDLPGGSKCRLVVLYSNGLRAAKAATGYFALPPKVPQIEVFHPRDGQTFAPWVPVELAAQIVDEEYGTVHDDDYVWELDGKEVCRGSVASLEELSEGSHRLTLRYAKAPKTRRAPTCRFNVRRPRSVPHPPGRGWPDA